MSEEGVKLREGWISHAEVLLGAGKGHLGVICYLRDEGLAADDAKRVSYDIFDEAKRRLLKSQRVYRFLGWGLIAFGLLGPILLFVLRSQIVIVSAAPLLVGLGFLSKVANPSRLPE
ncbi:MAG: hypothetical protein ACSHYF_15970 [Verrucomicrobiaceae bacterium]